MNNLFTKQMDEISSALCRINSIYNKWAKKQGLNYNSLMVLYSMSGTSGCTQKSICDKWMLPKQTVNTILSDFKNKGLIYYETDSKDKREKIIRFTEQGQIYTDTILEKLTVLEDHVMNKMGAELCQKMVESSSLFCQYFDAEVENE